jgi:hypothetical protein
MVLACYVDFSRLHHHEILGGHPNILLIEPMSYVPFVELMRKCWMIIMDSGGVQEEAPSLGRPVPVLREKTERPEAVASGTVTLVSTNGDLIVSEATRLLDDREEYIRMTRVHIHWGRKRLRAELCCYRRVLRGLARPGGNSGSGASPSRRRNSADSNVARASQLFRRGDYFAP